MEQLDQLIAMRDQAKERLEAALAAIEKSPDARLVKSLSSLIEDLQDALGIDGDAEDTTVEADAKEEAEETPVEAVAPEAPVEAEAEEATVETAGDDEAEEDAEDAGDFSLEESLEAELMGNELAADDKSAAASAS